MASSKQLVMVGFAVALVLLPTIAMAAEYVVGDDKGWTINFDYQSWAKDKTFYVGDTLGIILNHYTCLAFHIYKPFAPRIEHY